MSVIVAKSSHRRSTSTTNASTFCFPAVRVSSYVGSGTSSVVDTVSTLTYCMVKYYVVVCTSDMSAVRSFELLASSTAGTASHVVYGILGDTIDVDVDVSVSSDNLDVTVTNSDTRDVYVYATRVAVPISVDTPAPSDGAPTTISRTYVASADTKEVDFFDVHSIGTKLLVTIINASGAQASVNILCTPSGVVSYGYIGTITEYDISVVDVATFGTEILLTNNSAEAIKVIVTRTPIVITDTDVISCNVPTVQTHPSSTVVPSHTAMVVDSSASTTTHTGVEWLIHSQLSNSSATAVSMLSQITSSATSDVTYGRIGSPLKVHHTTSLSGTSVNLITTNNTSYDATVNVLRVPIGI